jgi:NAD(P)-dependent dehydrogenase (short-subunit alcohol dehydrogenase family)
MCATQISGSRSVDLHGQVAIVTGGGRGLGPLLAQGLAAAGAAVAVVARSAPEVTATTQRIQEAGGQALAVAADVTDQQAIERLVSDVEHQFGVVDLLVNNAGLLRAVGSVWEVDPAQWWREVEVNLRGPFLCARAVLPGMIARRRGRIINVASLAGTGPMSLATAYTSSKAALINFTDSLAAETKDCGVSIFAIQPGIVRSSMNDYLLTLPIMRERHPWFHQLFEEGRAHPTELAVGLVVALAAGKADALSGRFISVDDNLDLLVQQAETIVRDDLHTLRLRV